MPSGIDPNGPDILSGELSALMDSASEMLGAAIEIKSPVRSQSFGAIHLPDCSSCALHGTNDSRECEARRDLAARKIGDPTEYEHWVGPCGCEVTVLPVHDQAGPPMAMIAIRPSLPDSPPAIGPGETVRFLKRMGRLVTEHLSLARECRRAAKKFNQAREELDLLTTIAGKLGEERDVRQAVQRVLAQACRAVGADAGFVHIGGRRFLEVATGDAVSNRLPSSSRTWRRLAERVSDHFRIQNRRFFAGTYQELGGDEPQLEANGRIFALSIPIQADALGILCFVHLNGTPLRRESEMKLLESVADRIGMAISNHDLYEDLKESQIATVKSLVSAIEAKDPYTSGHSERVHILAMLLGKTLSLSDEELEVLKWASILHDVGKIGMPGRILNKPGKLTPAEFEIMKEHPERGYKVLAPIHDLAAASLAVRSHHEMIDGRGYPLGLRGSEIPRAARIISVADTYDALTSNRAYRPRRSPDMAFAVIESVRGTQLDPEVVDALGTLLPFIREHEVMLQSGVFEQAPFVEEEPKAEAA